MNGRLKNRGITSWSLLLGLVAVFAQSHAQTPRTSEDAAAFRKQVSQIAEKALASFQKDGRFAGMAGGGEFDASKPNHILMGFSVNLKVPDGGDQKYTITMIRFGGATVGKQSAEFQLKRMKAPLPKSKRPILGRLGGEGLLGIGGSSYYLGTTSAMREGTAYVNHKHEAFAWKGIWIVKVHAHTFKKSRSAAIKAMEKELLEKFLGAASGAKVATLPSRPATKRIETRQPAGKTSESVWNTVSKKLTDTGVDQGEFMKPRVWEGKGYRRLKVWRKLTVTEGKQQVYSIGIYRFENAELAGDEIARVSGNLKKEEKNERDLVFRKLACHGNLPIGNGGFLKAHEMEMRGGNGPPRKAYQYYSAVLSGNWVFTIDSVGNKVDMSKEVGKQMNALMRELVDTAAAK